jgi:hypothetical protein
MMHQNYLLRKPFGGMHACFFFCHEADLSSISELLAMLFYLLLQRTSILLNFKGNVLTNEFQSFPCQAK